MPKKSVMRGLAGRGRSRSAATAGARTTGRSSGVMNSMRNSSMAKSVAKHPVRSGLIGGGAAAMGMGLAKTRRSGLDKTKGRPTGMYNY
jgi:hypothetical protein